MCEQELSTFKFGRQMATDAAQGTAGQDSRQTMIPMSHISEQRHCCGGHDWRQMATDAAAEQRRCCGGHDWRQMATDAAAPAAKTTVAGNNGGGGSVINTAELADRNCCNGFSNFASSNATETRQTGFGNCSLLTDTTSRGSSCQNPATSSTGATKEQKQDLWYVVVRTAVCARTWWVSRVRAVCVRVSSWRSWMFTHALPGCAS